MKMKRFLSALLTAGMLVSLTVLPAHASGFSSANILDGGPQIREELKASYGNSASYYNRTNSGSGANRSVEITMNTAFKKQRALVETGIAGNSGDEIHFAHARLMIAVKKVGSENVVLRLQPVDGSDSWIKDNTPKNTVFNLVYSNEYSTYGWMSTYGGINKGITENDQCHIYTSTDPTDRTTDSYEGRNFLRFGTTDTPDYQTFDFIFDCYKGYVYGFIDGRLVATKIDAITNYDDFRGYTITGSGDETCYANGTKVWFKYDSSRPGETLYVDTDDYTVRLEDVLVDAGLATTNGDLYNIMESDHIGDYIFSGTTSSGETNTYERRASNGTPVSVTAEKLVTSSGNVAQLYGGFYHKDHDYPGYAYGKGIVHVSFDQQINSTLNSGAAAASTDYSLRLRAQGGSSYILFNIQANSGNAKIVLQKQKGNSDPSFTLDKGFNDKIHYDIILCGKHYSTSPATETVVADGYYFADGKYIGSYTLNRGSDASTPGTDEWWTPTQLYLYSNNTANVTYSNYKIAVYEADKSVASLLAEISGDNSTALELSDDEVLDIGAGLNFKNSSVDVTNGSIVAGEKTITGTVIDFTSQGKMHLAANRNAKVEVDNGDDTTSQGFMVGMTGPNKIVKMTLDIDGGTYDGHHITRDFDFRGYEIGGLVNFGFTVNNIPSGVNLTLNSVE